MFPRPGAQPRAASRHVHNAGVIISAHWLAVHLRSFQRSKQGHREISIQLVFWILKHKHLHFTSKDTTHSQSRNQESRSQAPSNAPPEKRDSFPNASSWSYLAHFHICHSATSSLSPNFRPWLSLHKCQTARTTLSAPAGLGLITDRKVSGCPTTSPRGWESRTRQSHGHAELARGHTGTDPWISPPNSPSEEAFSAFPHRCWRRGEKKIAKPVGKPSYVAFSIKEMQRWWIRQIGWCQVVSIRMIQGLQWVIVMEHNCY